MLQPRPRELGRMKEEDPSVDHIPSDPGTDLVALSRQTQEQGISHRFKQWAHVKPRHKSSSHKIPKAAEPGKPVLKTTTKVAPASQVHEPVLSFTSRPLRQPSKIGTLQKAKTVLEKLMQPERITTSDEVQRLQHPFVGCNGAEAKYENFISYITSQENELMSRAGLVGLSFWFDRVLIQRQNSPRSEATPYICFSGLTNIDQAKRLHAELSKKKAREQYVPPLSLCYDLDSSVVVLAAGPDARLVRDRPTYTLCGSLVTLGAAEEQRIVTIGGVVRFNGTMWAMTSGHVPPSTVGTVSSSVKPLTEAEIDLEDYDHDVRPALVLKNHKQDLIVLDADVPAESLSRTMPTIGQVDKQGPDWSLLALSDRQLALPNYVRVGSKVVYLTEVAKGPICGEVIVMAGASGNNKTMTMELGSVQFHLPGGPWVTAWKLSYGKESTLRRGDSGSWVVDAERGSVLGHIIAITHKRAFLLPLRTVFEQLDNTNVSSVHSSAQACLPPVFDTLADLAQTYCEARTESLAMQSAIEAISDEVLVKSAASLNAQHAMNFLSRCPTNDARGFLSSIITRTGSNISAGLSRFEHLSDTEKYPWMGAQFAKADGQRLLQALKIACGLDVETGYMMRDDTSGFIHSGSGISSDRSEEARQPLDIDTTTTMVALETSRMHDTRDPRTSFPPAHVTLPVPSYKRTKELVMEDEVTYQKGEGGVGLDEKRSILDKNRAGRVFDQLNDQRAERKTAGAFVPANIVDNLQNFRRAVGINIDMAPVILEHGEGQAGGIYKRVLERTNRKGIPQWYWFWIGAIIVVVQLGVNITVIALAHVFNASTSSRTASISFTTLGALGAVATIALPAMLRSMHTRFARAAELMKFRKWIEETEALIAAGIIGRNKHECEYLIEMTFRKYHQLEGIPAMRYVRDALLSLQIWLWRKRP